MNNIFKKKNILVVFSFVLFFAFAYTLLASVVFTSDTSINLSGISPQTLFIRSGSAASLVTLNSNVLTATGIPNGSFFNLRTSSHDNTIRLSPSGSTLNFSFNSNDYSGSSNTITQWTLDSPNSGTNVSIILGVPEQNQSYTIFVNGAEYNDYTSDSNREISFTYSGGFSSARTFSLVEGSIAPGITDGILTSATIDTEKDDGVTLIGFIWHGTQPTGTSVNFQIAVSDSPSDPWNFFGPGGSSEVWYGRACPRPGPGSAGPNVPICVNKTLANNYQYLRYRVRLRTNEEGTATPVVEEIVTLWAD